MVQDRLLTSSGHVQGKPALIQSFNVQEDSHPGQAYAPYNNRRMEQGRPVSAGRRRPHTHNHQRVRRHNAPDLAQGPALADHLLRSETGRAQSVDREPSAQQEDSLLLQCGRSGLAR